MSKNISRFYDDVIYFGLRFGEAYDLSNAAEVAVRLKKILGKEFQESIERGDETSRTFLIFERGEGFMRLVMDSEGLMLGMSYKYKPKTITTSADALELMRATIRKLLNESDFGEKFEDARVELDGYYVPTKAKDKTDAHAVLELGRKLSPRQSIPELNSFSFQFNFDHKLGTKDITYDISQNKKDGTVAMKVEIVIEPQQEEDSLLDTDEVLALFDAVDIESELNDEYEILKQLDK